MSANSERLLDELSRIAQQVAVAAGEFLLGGFRNGGRIVSTKSSGTDMVSEMDAGAEELLVAAIVAARPLDGILGEEGANRRGTSGVRWVIDPLDGTTNYLYGIANWSVSIGVELDGESVVGVVAAPALSEFYVGVRGRGATRNGVALAVSNESVLGLALVGTGFGYSSARRAYQSTVMANVLPQVRDIRRFGSAALDICAVASGHLDAYFEVGVNPWDVCAGDIIVRESGGTFGSYAMTGAVGPTVEPGGPGRPIMAANGLVDQALLEALSQAHIGVGLA
jgi:myo-inositol-1(or 4)-monophosphatase